MGVLGEKAVAGMDGLHVADLGGADDAVDHQIAFAGRRGADAIRLVGERQVMGAAVGLAEDGDRLDAHFLAGPNDAQGDFAPIGH